MTLKEVWKDIPGYDGICQVSDYGNVRSLDREVMKLGFTKRIKGIPRKQYKDKAGYMIVALQKENKSRNWRVHRLVAFAFFGESIGDRICVNHRNGKKADNRVENLEWCSYGDNNRHSYDVLNRATIKGESHGQSKLTGKQVLYIRKSKNSPNTLAKKFNVTASTISSVLNRKTWKHI